MGDFFADTTSTVDVEFPEDGVIITMRKYLDAGIREKVKSQMLKLTVNDAPVNGNGAEAGQEAHMYLGDFMVLSHMITKVQLPPGQPAIHIPVSNGFLRKLKPSAAQRLVGVINEYNPLAGQEPGGQALEEALAISSDDGEPGSLTATNVRMDGTGG